MIKVLSNIIAIILAIISIVYCIKLYKKSETVVEKVLYILLLIVYFVPIVIYFLDKYNVPTLFEYTVNVDSDRWFDFIISYVSTIIGTVVSSVILVLITFKQIKIQIDSNNDDKRIQNAPIFKYDINSIKIQTDLQYYILNNKDNSFNNYSLFINIENVGLNHARNIYFRVQGNDFENKTVYKLDNSQSILKRDDNRCIELIFNYKYLEETSKNNKQINITVYYEDLLNNKYQQEIIVYLEVTNKFGSEYGGYQFYIVSVKIENESYINNLDETKY